MKVLFMDVDGVLNSYAAKRKSGSMLGMCWEHVTEMDRVVSTTGCSIVVSSTWRFGGVEVGSNFQRALSLHGKAGQRIHQAVIDTTIDGNMRWFDRRVLRGDEIQEWLDRHPVEGYAVVDDDVDAEKTWEGKTHPFVRTSMAEGLTPALADQLIEILMRPAVEVAQTPEFQFSVRNEK